MHDSRIIRPLSNQYFHDSMIFFCHRLMFSSVLVMYTSWMILLYLWVSTIGMMSMSYGSHVFFCFFIFPSGFSCTFCKSHLVCCEASSRESRPTRRRSTMEQVKETFKDRKTVITRKLMQKQDHGQAISLKHVTV
jgi:hypothetical protein